MEFFVLALLAPLFAAVIMANSWQQHPHHRPGSKDIVTLVDLGYAIYEGEQLSTGVNQYLGMQFAAAPLGELRFRAPSDPIVNRTVQPATQVRHSGPIRKMWLSMLAYSTDHYVMLLAPQ